MPDDEPNETSEAGADEAQPGWAAPGQAPREPAAPSQPAPGEQTQTQPPLPPPGETPSAAWQAVPTAPGPVSGAPPAGVPRRGRKRWLVVLIAVLSVTVLMVIVGSILFADRSLPPYNAARDFINDVYNGHGNAATARLCGADSERSERAISLVKFSFESTTNKPFVNPLSVDRTGNGATVEYTVDRRGTASSLSYELPLRQEGGDWLACPLSGQG
jgi:hypothetical protein